MTAHLRSFLSLLVLTYVIPFSAHAQDRLIDAPELVQFYKNLSLKTQTLLDMNRHELRGNQEKDLIAEITAHYSEDALLDLSYFGVEDQRLTHVKSRQFSRDAYGEALLGTYEDPRNVTLYARVGKTDLKGERATAQVIYSLSYDMVLDDEEKDMISASWHVQEQAKCTDKLHRTAKGGLEIRHSTCETRFKITKFQSKVPEPLQLFSPRTSGYFLASAM